MKGYGFNEISEMYPSSSHYACMKEIDSFGLEHNATTRYVVVHEKTGEKSKYGGDIYKDNPLYFKETSFGSGKYILSDNPYTKKK